MTLDKTGSEPEWMRWCEDIQLVSSFKGEMIRCSRCKKKWFDSWMRVKWPTGEVETMCQDCFEKKVEGKKEENKCRKKPRKKRKPARRAGI